MLNAVKVLNLAGVGKINMIGYTPDGVTGPLPTLVFFTGAGESVAANGVGDPNKLFVNGPLNFVKNAGWNPAFNIYAFQNPTPWGPDWGHDPAYVRACLTEIVNGNYGVDKNRLYLTGLSYGCAYIMNYLQFCPDATYISPAAVIPMSMDMWGTDNSKGDYLKAVLGKNDLRFLNTPMWAFCGISDPFNQSL